VQVHTGSVVLFYGADKIVTGTTSKFRPRRRSLMFCEEHFTHVLRGDGQVCFNSKPYHIKNQCNCARVVKGLACYSP